MAGGRRKKNRRRLPLERRYGFFRCKNCNGGWESSYVFCIAGTLKVLFKQECKKCRIMTFPYKTEDIICSYCDCSPCECPEDERRHHNDPRKPHRRDLCEKCKRGWICDRYKEENTFFDFQDGYDDYD